MKKVLVTGGAGFIGRSVVNLLQDSYQVTVLDNFSFSNEDQLGDIIDFLIYSINNHKISFLRTIKINLHYFIFTQIQ